ncbi:MAG: hypothetical protein KGY76_07345 [Candidatus Thermoplasmatota archaeon]|nr:hypothetical protein [Candidatus Thermoplasmatota archaeon]
MRLYVELYFSPSGKDPLEVVESLKEIGFEPVVGEYDFAQDYDTPSEYSKMVEELTRALRGTDTRFRLITRKD